MAVGDQGGVHGQHILAEVAVNITIEEGGEGKRVREVYRTQGAGLTMACSPPASLLDRLRGNSMCRGERSKTEELTYFGSKNSRAL